MMKLKLYLGYSGFCYAKERIAIKGGRNIDIKFHALFGLICHPQKGWILYDTGYSTRFYEATKSFPNLIYSRATQVLVSTDCEAKKLLQDFGLCTDDIAYIILTHFHADHIGGLRDFPKAKIICSMDAYEYAKKLNPLLAFTKGVLKSLIPTDIEERLCFIEDLAVSYPDENWGTRYDLFSDDSLMIYHLPGHAAGQIGLVIETLTKKYFLIADACWLKRSYQELILPNPIVRFFFDSWKKYKTTLKKVHQFHKTNPDILIIPTHCEATTRSLIANENLLNEI